MKYATIPTYYVHIDAFVAGILHKSSDIDRMNTYISNGLADTASHQYSDYLLFAANSYSSDAYAMSTPVATLSSRASFEADAAAAYHNALVRTPCVTGSDRLQAGGLTHPIVS